MKRHIVKVLTQHISSGVRDDAWNCPVALALKESIRSTRIVNVDYRTAELWLQGQAGPTYVELPPNVGRWIRGFDAHGTGRPIQFSIAVPG